MYMMPDHLLQMCNELGCKKIVIQVMGSETTADELDVFIDIDNDDLCNTLYCWAEEVFEGTFDSMYEYDFSYTYDLEAMEIRESGVEGVLANAEDYSDEDDAYGGRWLGEAY